ncbi:MAG: response regulator transcription factor [Flavobacteriia bacterium]|nr:response regulator transcription factor [Flavobacteriia bacterium]
MKKVCLVEDEINLSESIKLNLELEGFNVITFNNGKEMLNHIEEIDQYSLLILDVMLPEVSGYTLCKEIRKVSKIPILFISAKGNTQDRIYGLKLGANDYLPKPFDLEEFLLKVQILIQGVESEEDKFENELFEFSNFLIDFKQFLLINKSNNQKIDLNKRECALLKLFINNIGKVISRDEILDTLWDEESIPNSRTIDNYILNFRKWMEKNPKEPKYFHSIRGVGYKFTPN